MWLIALALLVILALAGLVAVFAAFTDRGEQIPNAPRLSEAMDRLHQRLGA